MSNANNDVKEYSCPKCESLLNKKSGKYGDFYGCSNYPECKFVAKVCPKCSNPLFLKDGKYGKFLSCANYPKCRYSESYNGNKADVQKSDILIELREKTIRDWGSQLGQVLVKIDNMIPIETELDFNEIRDSIDNLRKLIQGKIPT